MRFRLVIGLVLGLLALGGFGNPAKAAAPGESWLFTVQAADARTVSLTKAPGGHERFRIVLRDPAPVTQFSDRPFRDARLISPRALATHWGSWFADSPPNAVLAYAQPGSTPLSFVVELTSPRWNARTRELSFIALRNGALHDPVSKGPRWERPITPVKLSGVNVFIDDAGACDPYAGELACASVDLSGQDFQGMDFTGADLSNANLQGAFLQSAILTGANLTGANLTGANLTGAVWTDGTTVCGWAAIGTC